MSPTRTGEPEHAPIVWHDIECGAYHADLPLWQELAGRAARSESCEVLDLGCGTGRVSLDLAARAHRVTGLDVDARLAGELRRRAAERNVPAGAVIADMRDFDLGRRFDLVLAAMQLLQLLPSREDRIAALGCARAHLRPQGLFAAALMDLHGEATDEDYLPPLPDMLETGGWVWSSQPVAIRIVDRGSAITLDRHRRAVSPRGEMAESSDSVRLVLLTPGELEDELREVGLVPVERRIVPATTDHVGSSVVIARVSDG